MKVDLNVSKSADIILLTQEMKGETFRLTDVVYVFLSVYEFNIAIECYKGILYARLVKTAFSNNTLLTF